MSNQKTFKHKQVICDNIIGLISNYSMDKEYYQLNNKIHDEVNLNASRKEWKDKYIVEMTKLKLNEIILIDGEDKYIWKNELLRVIKFEKWKYFCGIYNLTYLQLCRRNLKTIPKEIGNLINLKILDLSYNELRTLPIEFGDLYNLETLFIDNNLLEEIPSEIFSRISKNIELDKKFNLIKLKELFLGYNKLKKIPDSICNLTNLENLQIQNNNFTEIPKIEKLINLRVIFFGNNDIKIFPEEICNLNKLEFVNLNDNKIIELPKNLQNLSELILLNLHNNSLNYIPIELTKCLNLQILQLTGNPIKRIPIEIISSKKIIITIDYNNLTLGTKIIGKIYSLINILKNSYKTLYMIIYGSNRDDSDDSDDSDSDEL